MVLEDELRVAEKAARAAGQVAMDLMNSGSVRFKANNEGPVTDADIAADIAIQELLKQAFPQDSIISEESFTKGDPIPDSGRVWFVDPIDGTSYYIKGEDDFAVMIGLAVDQNPVLGVVFQPATGVLWAGIDTRNATRRFASYHQAYRQEPTQLKPTFLNIVGKNIGEAGPVAVASRQHPSQFIDFLTAELNVSHIIKKGSVGLKLVLIADGKADFYLTSTKRLKLWDTCAPSVILTAAGGFLKSMRGDDLLFSGSIQHDVEIYAATPSGARWLKERLPDAIKKWQHQLE